MNLTDFLDQSGVQYNTDRPGWLRMPCPFCVHMGIGKHTQGLYLGITTNGVATCWRCGILPLAKTLSEITKIPEPKIWPIVKGIRARATQFNPKIRGKLKLPKSGDLKQCHKDYLKSRGFNSDNLVKLWGVQGIAQHARYGWRILIPICLNGEVVSFTTRSIDPNDKVRYLSAKPEEEAYPHKQILMGLEYTRDSTIVTEGPLKMMAIGHGATCTFGINVTQAQLLQISKIGKRYMAFDMEPLAQKMAGKWCKQLGAFPGETFRLELETATEVDLASIGEIKKLRRLLT